MVDELIILNLMLRVKSVEHKVIENNFKWFGYIQQIIKNASLDGLMKLVLEVWKENGKRVHALNPNLFVDNTWPY